LQIFCDESGGAGPSNELFLVAAVALPTSEAVRLMKSFHKAAKWRGEEVKGYGMAFKPRKIFFDLLTRQVGLESIVVTCSRCDLVGGWAMSTLAEVDLYGHLLHEACLALPKPDGGFLTVTPDGGRYKKAEYNAISATLENAIAQRSPIRVSVGFEDSAKLAGLQIADVVANSVFQALGDPTGPTAELLQPLMESARLVTRHVEMQEVRPSWIADLQKAEKPPEGSFSEDVDVPTLFLSK
jgi:hypothetical protein